MGPVGDLNNLLFFTRVVDYGSFTAAADALGMQTSKLSRRVAALESELGVRLLNRTTRKLSLTEAGKTFHRHCVALLDEAQAARDAISQTLASPHGLVRISCPTGLLQGGVAAFLVRFLSAHPQVRIALDATNRRVDVIDEGIDIALRVRQPPLDDSVLAMRSFGPSDLVLVASPQLLAEYGMPRDTAALQELPTLAMAQASERYLWRLQVDGGQFVDIAHQPRIGTDDLHTLRVAALQGIGVALLPTLLISDALERGDLVRVLPTHASRTGIVHAVFPSRRGMVPAVRALLDFLAEEFAARPWTIGP
jgi:DNA-binding transcriptional LysR family regulator